MRILVDYRPALRSRTGVGEYVHELARAYAASYRSIDELLLFTSSWKDRPAATLAAELGSRVVDRRIPGRLLHYAWHRLEWPPVEHLAGQVDVAHALHPLLIPTRRAAQVVTIHDLFFLTNPELTEREIRRDYPRLAIAHAQRADAIVTPSGYSKGEIVKRLGVPADHIAICPPGAPLWSRLGRQPNIPGNGYVLFVGTLEPRKNIARLLDAWLRVTARVRPAPRLVIAGRAAPAAAPWVARMTTAPLSSSVELRGYVPSDGREALYTGARALVLPSLDEGFGIPALEAMSAGIPVVVSNRGALPDVVGDAGVLVDPMDIDALASALERVLLDDAWAAERACAGLTRARSFSWAAAATTLRRTYQDAVARRQARA